MKICHTESGNVYEITEQKESYKLFDSKNNKSYSFKESYEAIWFTIELIRGVSFDILSDENLNTLVRKAQLPIPSLPKSVIQQLKKEKISHTYYDQVFLKLLTAYRCGHQEINVSNQTNFDVQHELIHMVRKLLGAKLSIPTIKA
jgi:hypothetical protein